MDFLSRVVRAVCIFFGLLAVVLGSANALDTDHPTLVIPTHILLPAGLVWGGLLLITTPEKCERWEVRLGIALLAGGVIGYLIVPPCAWDATILAMMGRLPADYPCL